MRKFIIIAIFGFMAFSASVFAQNAVNPSATTFFHTLNDVPVMLGLRELPEESVNFDKPEGRIMGATAVSETVRPAAIRNFYSQTLPQLGWVVQPDGSFLRDRERLTLNIEAPEGVSVVRLQVGPQ